MGLFLGERPRDFSVRIRNIKISGKQQTLPKQQMLSSNEIRTGKSLGLFPRKRPIEAAFPHRGCVSNTAYYLKI